MRKYKYISLILIIFIIFTSINKKIVFAENNNLKYQKINFDNSKNLLDINKEATPLNTNETNQLKDRSYKITLNLKANQKYLEEKKGQDIILAIDKSGSMNDWVEQSPFKSLKNSVNEFSKNILEKNNTDRISIIAFSSKFIKLENIKDYLYSYNGIQYQWMTYYIDDSIDIGNKVQQIFIGKDYYGRYFAIDGNHNYIALYYNLYGNGEFYIMQKNGHKNDAELVQNFTNNYSDIEKSVMELQAIGGTDTESAIDMISKQLSSVVNNNRSKYVILFTDGLPSVLLGEKWKNPVNEDKELIKDCEVHINYFKDQIKYCENIIKQYPDAQEFKDELKKAIEGLKSYEDRLVDIKKPFEDYKKLIQRYIYVTESKYRDLMSKYKNVKFISLGFKNKYSEQYSSMTREFLSSIQNYNKEINGENLIFIDTPEDINAIYEKIANNIIKNSEITEDAIITDNVPDNFEIVKGSENPKGAVIEGNKIYWSDQQLNASNQAYTFTIKAKDNYYGTDSLVNDKSCISDKVATNTYADVVYTNKIDNIRRKQVFNIPIVSVPNKAELKLKPSMTVFYGQKIKLKDLIKTLHIEYGPESDYEYIWKDDYGNKIKIDNQNKNALVGNNFNNQLGNDGIIMTKSTKFKLRILNKHVNKNMLDLNDSINIEVIKPKVTVIKKVIDDYGKEVKTDDLFSINICGDNNLTWNADLTANKPFSINGIIPGIYNIKEISSQGYSMVSIKANGQRIKDNTFSINVENPTVNIEIINKQIPTKYFNENIKKSNDFITK